MFGSAAQFREGLRIDSFTENGKPLLGLPSPRDRFRELAKLRAGFGFPIQNYERRNRRCQNRGTVAVAFSIYPDLLCPTNILTADMTRKMEYGS